MSDIFLHGIKVDSIFQLLGEHENDISYSVAWALAQCPAFLQEFLKQAINIKANCDEIEIRLQHSEGYDGITDIEIELENEFYIIIEAKQGWNLPSLAQLRKYAKRLIRSKAPIKRLVVLSECSKDYANHNLEKRLIGSIEITPISWKSMYYFASNAYEKGSHAEKRLLSELRIYLGGLMTMQNIDSNWVYVVSLSIGIPEGWKIPGIDVIQKKKRYFHAISGYSYPTGGKEPPNYIAFRYFGKLQSIHHIEDYEVFVNPHDIFPELPDKKWHPHYLYKLGPAFFPNSEVRTGRLYANQRVWCMLDTLFICESISKARDLSWKRMETAE